MNSLLRIFKGSSLLNILGMTAAFAALYILLAQVSYDLGYNKEIKDIERLYVVATPSSRVPGNVSVYTNKVITSNVLDLRTTENADLQAVIKYVRESIAELAGTVTPESVNVQFFDEELGEQYQKEQQLTKIVTMFTLLAIIISLMGVMGLVIFETQYRRKEIGIRRVHGATIDSILSMFNIRFAKILLACMTIAAPISWFVMDYYYSAYAFRSPLYWWVFLCSFILVAVIVMAVVTVSSWKAAVENPVKSLRSE